MREKDLTLGDCLELITYGFTNPMPDAGVGPWKVTAKDIVEGRIEFESARKTTVEAFEDELTDKSRPKKGDILLTKDGTLGRIAMVGNEIICINQSVALLRVDESVVCSRFLYHYLQSPKAQQLMLQDAGGATIKHIYITRVVDIDVPMYSREKQIRIASVLDVLDQLIENNRRQIKLLEEAAQRLYKEWFIDLRFPGHETTPIIDGLPEGWRRLSLPDFADIQYGFAFKASEFNDAGLGYPIIRIRNVPSGYSNDYTTEIADDKYFVQDGDIVIGMDGDFYINTWKGGKAYLVQRSCCVRPNDSGYRGYLEQALKQPIAEYQKGIVGATVAHLGKKHLDQIKISIPPIEFVQQFDALANQRLSLAKENNRLREARDRLLPKLMSGEIEV